MSNTLGTKEKSVHINIDSNYYGSVAEIGGGQETARHLFQAGGASNTVAKTISAYDKSFSDHFYNHGEPSRYVAEDRVKKMVEYEYNELLTILDKKIDQKFFAFANTVETLNYTKTNQGSGWLGIAVEGTDRKNPNKIFIHVKLHERDTLLQQYTLGTLGINLIYGALFMWEDPRKLLLTLLDNLDIERVEVDYIYVEGPGLTWVDNRILNLMLVSNNMTPAIMFDESGKVQQPGDMLYKKNVLLMRGYFRPVNNLVIEFLEESLEVFKRDEDYRPDNTIAFCEISLNNLMQDRKVDEKDFLHRVDLLNMVGQSVMVSNFSRYFELVNYFGQFKMIKLRVIMGMPTFDMILDGSLYPDLRGGLLESVGKLFHENVKLYLFPYIDMKSGEIISPDTDHFEGSKKLLWQYLNETKKILLLEIQSEDLIKQTSEHIRELIRNGDERLLNVLPEKVYRHIKENSLFDYNCNNAQQTDLI
ncbi:TonB-dependent receptor [Mangrovibacterium lignilyticum]|uniref:TonB-dependent receptor n=1 Tax=Mangrovibacterium lignilyticum TaxID=2668052 RepID=UPI0013D86110|nr:TonB-dependent receptor [Mangrovibacterium lignilyticum]